MDLVSVPHNSLAQKTFLRGRSSKSNGHTGNGQINGHHLNGNTGVHANGFTECGHSDFMKIQRYEHLIGNDLQLHYYAFEIRSLTCDLPPRPDSDGGHHLARQTQDKGQTPNETQ